MFSDTDNDCDIIVELVLEISKVKMVTFPCRTSITSGDIGMDNNMIKCLGSYLTFYQPTKVIHIGSFYTNTFLVILAITKIDTMNLSGTLKRDLKANGPFSR